MKLPAVGDPVPLVFAEGGQVIRVAGSRVPLDTVVAAFKTGATPEEIVQDFSALKLTDVYAVIAYYLQHRIEVEEYLDARAAVSAEIERQVRSEHDHLALRERLLARLNTPKARTA